MCRRLVFPSRCRLTRMPGFPTGDHRIRVYTCPARVGWHSYGGCVTKRHRLSFPRLPHYSAEPPGRRGEAGGEFVGLLRGVFGCGRDIFHIGSLSLRYFR